MHGEIVSASRIQCLYILGRIKFKCLILLKTISGKKCRQILFNVMNCICLFIIKAQERGKPRISLFVLVCLQTCHFIMGNIESACEELIRAHSQPQDPIIVLENKDVQASFNLSFPSPFFPFPTMFRND